jgi:hypothetical protein
LQARAFWLDMEGGDVRLAHLLCPPVAYHFTMDAQQRKALLQRYRDGHAAVVAALANITPAELDRPAADGWTARQVVHHLADSEMTSAIRLRKLLAEDNPVIQGYDEEEFARRLFYNDRPIEASLAALKASRDTTAEIVARLSEEQWNRSGTHSESGAYGVETWLEIYAAHAHDHAGQIRRARGWEPGSMTTAEVLEAIAHERARLMAAVDTLGPRAATFPVTAEGWTAKDVLAHCIHWAGQIAWGMGAQLTPPAYVVGMAGRPSDDEWNALAVAHYRGLSLEQVRATLDTMVDALVAQVTTRNDTEMNATDMVAGAGDRPLWGKIGVETFLHWPRHLADLERAAGSNRP